MSLVLTKLLYIVLISFTVSVLFMAVYFLFIRRTFVILNEMTPNIDEVKEISKGNQAVSEYFSRVISYSILGISIIVSTVIISVTLLIK
jgi:hypothetical protein